MAFVQFVTRKCSSSPRGKETDAHVVLLRDWQPTNPISTTKSKSN